MLSHLAAEEGCLGSNQLAWLDLPRSAQPELPHQNCYVWMYMYIQC